MKFDWSSRPFASLILLTITIVLMFIISETRVSPVSSPVTVVSGYWRINSKHTATSYKEWFSNTLRVKCPYVFFYDSQEVRDLVSSIRSPDNIYPTLFIHRNITHAGLKFNYSKHWTHHKHVKSASLAVIWLDKVHMIEDAFTLNPYQSEWFAWIDAGIAIYRDQPVPASVWPNPALLRNDSSSPPFLPRDKVIYSDSGSHPAHSFAGTAFMYHSSLVSTVRELFMFTYAACVLKYAPKPSLRWVCGIDQGHFTRMKAASPGLFRNTGVGYGTMVKELYNSRLNANTPLLYTRDSHPEHYSRDRDALLRKRKSKRISEASDLKAKSRD